MTGSRRICHELPILLCRTHVEPKITPSTALFISQSSSMDFSSKDSVETLLIAVIISQLKLFE